MKELTREQLSGKPRKVRTEWVPLGDLDPDLGPDGGVHVRLMSGRELNDYQQGQLKRKGTAKRFEGFEPDLSNSKAKLLCRTICNAAGGRLYDDDDADELGDNLDALVSDRIYTAAARLNGIREEEEDSLKNGFAPPPGGNG